MDGIVLLPEKVSRGKTVKGVLLCVFFPFLLGAGELPPVVAKFGTAELRREQFRTFSLPDKPDARRKELKKLVDTEVYLIILRQLLELSKVPPDENTARRYVELRRKQFGGKVPPPAVRDLESRVKDKGFQLKSALYFTFFAAVPEAVEPTPEAVGRHYELNKSKFRKPVRSEIALFRAGNNDAQGREQAKIILARLRQGEDFQALARQFDPGGSRGRAPAEDKLPFARAVKELKPGETLTVPAASGIYMLKLVSRTEEYIPLSEAAPAIREILSSRMLKEALEQYMREILAKTPVQYFF